MQSESQMDTITNGPIGRVAAICENILFVRVAMTLYLWVITFNGRGGDPVELSIAIQALLSGGLFYLQFSPFCLPIVCRDTGTTRELRRNLLTLKLLGLGSNQRPSD